MTPLYLLLIGLFLLSGPSEGQNEALSEAQVDLPQEKLPENSEIQETSLSEDQGSTMNCPQCSQDCSSSLYQIGQDVGALTETLKSTIRRLEETTRRLEHSEAQFAALNNTLSTVLNKEKIKVAFTASRPVDGSLTAGAQAHVPLVYKHVETNLGNAYSPLTGFFTAPVKGVYSFSFTSMFLGSGSSGGSLHHNGKRVVSWHRNGVNHRTSGSNSAVLMLNAGDKVNVYLWAGTTIYGHVYNYSTFSGFLLYTL